MRFFGQPNQKQTSTAHAGGGGGKTGASGADVSPSLFRAHMAALLKKRLLTFKRDKKMWAFVVLMPAFFVLIGTLILLAVATSNEPSLLLTPTVCLCSLFLSLSHLSIASLLCPLCPVFIWGWYGVERGNRPIAEIMSGLSH